MSGGPTHRLLYLAAAGCIVIACSTNETDRASLQRNSVGSPTVMAATLAVGARGVRWVSSRIQCVPAVEVGTVDECTARPIELHPDSVRRVLRKALWTPDSAADSIACLRISREISRGDSTLVVVSIIGASVADGFAESESKAVWFWNADGHQFVWIAPNFSPVSDVAPVLDESKC